MSLQALVWCCCPHMWALLTFCRYKGLTPPARAPAEALRGLLGSRSPSFGIAKRASSVTVSCRKVESASAGLEVQRSSYSTTLLQGNVDLLLARLPAGPQFAGKGCANASPLGQRMPVPGSRLQQQSAVDSRGTLLNVPSVGAGLDAMAQTGDASGYWVRRPGDASGVGWWHAGRLGSCGVLLVVALCSAPMSSMLVASI